jgi:hypothetical protein
MRAFILAAALAGGIGLASLSPSAAAPASGRAIGEAATVTPAVEQVHWWRRHHRHHRHHRPYCWWHRGHVHCW